MTILDRVPVERIGERAHDVDLGRALLSLLMLPFLALGFAAALVWTAAEFAWAAVLTGWDAGRARSQPGRPAEAIPRSRTG
jgi:hypothetical protein